MSRRSDFIKSRCPWLGNGAPVPRELAEGVVRASLRWLSHGLNRDEVESPGMAKYIRLGPYGWELPLGANRFAVEEFVRKARAILQQALSDIDSGTTPSEKALRPRIAFLCPTCIITSRDKLYSDYPMHGAYVHLGAHAVDAGAAADYLIQQSYVVHYRASVGPSPSRSPASQGDGRGFEPLGRKDARDDQEPSGERPGRQRPKSHRGSVPPRAPRPAFNGRSSGLSSRKTKFVKRKLRELEAQHPRAKKHRAFLRVALKRYFDLSESTHPSPDREAQLRAVVEAMHDRILGRTPPEHGSGPE